MRRRVISRQCVLAHKEPQYKNIEVTVNSSTIISVKMGEHELCTGLSVATTGTTIIRTKTPERTGINVSCTSQAILWAFHNQQNKYCYVFDWFCKWRDPYLIKTLPSIFQRAAICPKKDSQVIERLLMMAWLSRITAWKAKTTYLDARYPPPLLPPVLSRTMTWISCAREKSILAVPAHCKRKDGIVSPLILKIEGRKGASENCLVTCPTMLNLKAMEVIQ